MMQKQSGYRFLIPSYKRCERQKTIEYLHRIGCDKERIILSTQTEEDYYKYSEKWGSDVGIVLYKEGDRVSKNANTLLDYCDPNEKIVLLEDDLNKVVKLYYKEDKKKVRSIDTIQELDSIIRRGFRLAELNQTICFGVNMVINPFFMQDGYTCKRLVHTGFMGLVNSDLRFDENLKLWHDPDMNCQVIRRYGCCVSLNDVGADIDRFVSGGCSEAWGDNKTVLDSKKYFFKKNCDLCEIGHKGLFKLRKEVTRGL